MSWEDLPFSSREEAVGKLKDMGYKEEVADKLADTLEEEASVDEGQPETLWESIKEGAKAVISNLNLETFSWVENPAQRSEFVMMKSENGFESSSPILKEKEDDWEVAYAPVMVPGEVDKDGESIPGSVIKKAAHQFLSEGKVDSIDSDHNLITGKGTLVESWLLKEDREYVTPDGGSFMAPAGTWMAGVKPEPEVKERIDSGELTGFSIFGEAERIKLKETFKSKAEKDCIDSMSEEAVEKLEDKIESVAEKLESLSESVSEIKETQEKQEIEELSDALDWLEENAPDEVAGMIADAIRSSSDEEEEEKEESEENGSDEDVEDKEEEEHEEQEDVDDRDGKSVKQKGADEDDVRDKALETEGSTRKTFSYKSMIEGDK